MPVDNAIFYEWFLFDLFNISQYRDGTCGWKTFSWMTKTRQSSNANAMDAEHINRHDTDLSIGFSEIMVTSYTKLKRYDIEATQI